MWFRQPQTGRKPRLPRSNGLPAPRPMPPPTAAIRQVALGQGEFIEGHELDRKGRVPKEMIGRRLSQEEAKSGQLTSFGAQPVTLIASSKVTNLLTFRFSSPRNSNWRLISKPPKGLTSKVRQRCSRAPMR